MARASNYLTRAALSAHRNDPYFRATSLTRPFVSILLAVWFAIVLFVGFGDATKYKCEFLPHHYYYRIGLVLGLWAPGGLMAVTTLLTFVGVMVAQQHDRRKRRLAIVRYVLRMLTSAVEMALAAWLMNIAYWYMLTVLYYETPPDDQARLFDPQVNDIFGRCVSGFGEECTTWQ